MIVSISGNNKMIVAGIAAMPSMNAIPCDPKTEMSHHRIPISTMPEYAIQYQRPDCPVLAVPSASRESVWSNMASRCMYRGTK
jgi:hypothetical protein